MHHRSVSILAIGFACLASTLATAAEPVTRVPAVFDPDADHPWNRLFAEFYVRERVVDVDGKPVRRFEGGDYIDLLAWGRTGHWDQPAVARDLEMQLDGFLESNAAGRIADPLKRVILLRDLWAAHDFLVSQNIRRAGTPAVRQRRAGLCRRLAEVIRSLALSPEQIAALPDNYAAAVASGRYGPYPGPGATRRYLPPGLLIDPDRWVEIEFFQPNLHTDVSHRFITLHTRAYRGRSYFRIFYRFPGGRGQLAEYLKLLGRTGIDWRRAAQNGFILLKPDAPQVPVGTEVALVQFMMTLDDRLRPRPTRIVESLRHRQFRNVDGSALPDTNTGVGVEVTEFTLKRRLLFDRLDRGGLVPEPMDLRQFRIIFQPPDAPDWGTEGHKVLFQQCIDCHMTPRHDRTGVHSMPSIVHMGGFDAGAQLGVARLMDPLKSNTRGLRVAKWKSSHETYRRLLEALGL